MLENI